MEGSRVHIGETLQCSKQTSTVACGAPSRRFLHITGGATGRRPTTPTSSTLRYNQSPRRQQRCATISQLQTTSYPRRSHGRAGKAIMLLPAFASLTAYLWLFSAIVVHGTLYHIQQRRPSSAETISVIDRNENIPVAARRYRRFVHSHGRIRPPSVLQHRLLRGEILLEAQALYQRPKKWPRMPLPASPNPPLHFPQEPTPTAVEAAAAAPRSLGGAGNTPPTARRHRARRPLRTPPSPRRRPAGTRNRPTLSRRSPPVVRAAIPRQPLRRLSRRRRHRRPHRRGRRQRQRQRRVRLMKTAGVKTARTTADWPGRNPARAFRPGGLLARGRGARRRPGRSGRQASRRLCPG